MNPLLEQFLQEARENLAFIDQNIEKISEGDEELLNAVFRAAHTLKGGSGIVGFESVKEITHHAEDLLDMLRSGKIEYAPELEEALYDAFDEVVNLIEAAEESEDIVEADEERTAHIIETLNTLMKKDTQEVSWELPFALVPDEISVVNSDIKFLEHYKGEIKYLAPALTEENYKDKRLYAIFFDVDENCMVFGNDPIYALSLLGDKLLGMNICLDEERSKAVLDADTEDELLIYRSTLIAYVDAAYEDIEEALFNFIDDILFKPLDCVSLLNITSGEMAALDVIKDFSKHAVQKLIEADSAGLKASIEETLTLIGTQTVQYKRLKRLLSLLDFIDTKHYEELIGFIEVLNSGEAFKATGTTATESQKRETNSNETPQAQADETDEELSFDAQDKEALKEILNQQLEQLRKYNVEATKKRVEALITKPIQRMGYAFQDSYSSCESLIEGIESVMAQIDGKAPQVQEQSQETQKAEKQSASKEVQAPAKKVEAPKPSKKEPAEAKKNVIGKTVKIEQESIDHLMNIVGELLVAKNSLPYLADNVHSMDSESIKRGILEKYSFINRLSMQLQDLIMGMRMLPISYVFDRYPKLVRDISKNLGKKVKLTMEGGETKLDKNIIEMLADPMIHIMRNSLDHGIELPEVRQEQGKSPEGNVTLKAYAQSDKIIIEIRDDGAGINVERVINKVLEKGLLTVEAIDKMSDREKAELVLLPGLSTAESITEYSGRGVGMDVVKKSIESFGGTISIETFPGKGTNITLAIPVSLAVTSLLHVSLGGVHYGFPMESVSETVKIEQSEIAILHNEPFVHLRGDVIPLLYIKQMLDFDAIGDGPLSLVVLNIKGNLIAVVVNELLGQLDVVQKPLEGVIESHPLFSGTALLGNGQIIMVIDQDGLLSMSHTLKDDQSKAG